MATLIAAANGNLTAAATWQLVDTTSFLESFAFGTTGLTTSYAESSAFAPGAITIDGIAVLIAYSNGPLGTGTMSIRLAQAGSTVAGTEVTINVSDLPTMQSATDTTIGWAFFKFASPVLLVAATNYTVSGKTSVINQVNLFHPGSQNWCRMLRTTTTQAPTTGDNCHILGEWTAAATKTDRTVTMDSTATTDYGTINGSLPTWSISKGGILTWGVAASTNYRLRLSGYLYINQGGIMNMGTAVAPCPRGSSMLMEFDSTGDGSQGALVAGTLVMQGLSRTSGKNVVTCKLNTNEAIGQTTWGVDTDTGWLSGDEVALASTSQTVSEAEIRILNANANAADLTVTVGLSAAHSGTSPTQARLILVTRPVRMESVSTTNMAFCWIRPTGVITAAWAGFRYMGTNSTNVHGLEIDANVSPCTLDYCAINNADSHGLFFKENSGHYNNVAITEMTMWKVGNQGGSIPAVDFGYTNVASPALSINGLYIISGNTGGTGYGLIFRSGKWQLSNIYYSSGQGPGISTDSGIRDAAFLYPITNYECHCCPSGGGFLLSGFAAVKALNVKVWRSGYGVSVGNTYLCEIDTFSFFGNSFNQVSWGTTDRGVFLGKNGVMSGDTSFSCPRGVHCTANNLIQARFENCTFGVVTGIFTAHTTCDVDFDPPSTTCRGLDLTLINCVLASATEFTNYTTQGPNTVTRRQRFDGTTNNHFVEYPFWGKRSREITTIHGTIAGQKLEPTKAYTSWRFESSKFRVPTETGQTRSISVWVRKNATYNGLAPRLIYKSNPAIGNDSDIVAATMSAPFDTWQQLTYTTAAAEEGGVLEFVIDCNGTAGAAFVSDWNAS